MAIERLQVWKSNLDRVFTATKEKLVKNGAAAAAEFAETMNLVAPEGETGELAKAHGYSIREVGGSVVLSAGTKTSSPADAYGLRVDLGYYGVTKDGRVWRQEGKHYTRTARAIAAKRIKELLAR